MGAHPPAADEARRTLQGKRLERLCDGALAAPSHARVVIIHRYRCAQYLIWPHESVPDVPVEAVPARSCHRSLAAPGAASGAPSTPTF